MFKTVRFMFLISSLHFPIVSTNTREYARNNTHTLRTNDGECVFTNENETMTCEEIPEAVPSYVKSVIVKRHNGILTGAFSGQSWEHVERLEISGQTTEQILENDHAGLDNVRQLSFSFPKLSFLSTNAFAVTPKVTKLGIMMANHFKRNVIFDALTKPGVLYNLTEFVFNPGNGSLPPDLLISDQALNELLRRPLVLLNISNSYIRSSPIILLKLLVKLDVINISGSYLFWNEIFPSLYLNGNNFISQTEVSNYSASYLNTTDTVPGIYLTMLDEKPLLKVFDISGATFPYRTQLFHFSPVSILGRIIFKSENVFANNMHLAKDTLNTSYNLTDEHIYLKRIMSRRSKLQRIEATYILNRNNNLEALDVSDNYIEYLCPDLFMNALQLKSIYLSNNRLNLMKNSSDFPKLFSSYSNLRVLHIDQNNNSFIPWGMFVFNKKLEILNVADNKLTTIGFNLEPLTSLQRLDIRRNAIHVIEDSKLVRLNAFFQERMKTPSGKNFEIMLQGNPLKCTCRSLDFIQSIDNYIFLSNKTPKPLFKCHYDGSTIPINKDVVEKCKFLCKRNLIIGLSTSGSVVVCAVLSAVYCAYKKVRRRHRLRHAYDNFKRAYQQGLIKQNRICFVAYASHDEDIVRQMLLLPLGDKLKEMLDTNRNMVATGYDFRPGFPIYDETFKVVQQSNVFIAVVSNAFCESQYCIGEIDEACAQRKPIIVILLGRVTEEHMSAYLLEVFRRKARASIVTTDEENFELSPTIDQISESVIMLAMDAYERLK